MAERPYVDEVAFPRLERREHILDECRELLARLRSEEHIDQMRMLATQRPRIRSHFVRLADPVRGAGRVPARKIPIATGPRLRELHRLGRGQGIQLVDCPCLASLLPPK